MNQSGRTAVHVVYITQDPETAWSAFIIDDWQGFTQPGVESLNDSIQTYVYAILNVQGRTRTHIIGTGIVFDGQRIF